MADQMSFAKLGGLGPTFELLLEKQLGLAFYRENLGRSRAKGIELLVKHSTQRWFGMLAYTFNWIDYPVSGLASAAFVVNGVWVLWNGYFAAYVVRHSLRSRLLSRLAPRTRFRQSDRGSRGIPPSR